MKSKLDFLYHDIQSIKLDKKYDLVILSEVLLHILPTEIDSIIKKLIALSNKHIINIDWYADHPPRYTGNVIILFINMKQYTKNIQNLLQQ